MRPGESAQSGALVREAAGRAGVLADRGLRGGAGSPPGMRRQGLASRRLAFKFAPAERAGLPQRLRVMAVEAPVAVAARVIEIDLERVAPGAALPRRRHSAAPRRTGSPAALVETPSTPTPPAPPKRTT